MYRTLVLSLVKDVERRKHISLELQSLGIDFEFFDAKTPADVTPEIKDILFSDIDIYSWDINHDNVLATFLSHLSILEETHRCKTNTLLLEDDLEYINEFDFINIDFTNFDIFNISDKLSCCAYFINWKSAKSISDEIKSNVITQAFDWELYKLKDKFRYKFVDLPIFKQTDKFISNLAPNGYRKYTSSQSTLG